MEHFDLLVIGGGIVGLSAAKKGADLGAGIIRAELIHLGAMAMKAGWTPEELEDLVMIHPSLAEGFMASVTSMRTGHREGCCG